jgi:hypothetical protein
MNLIQTVKARARQTFVRDAHQALFDREKLEFRPRRRTFYARFIAPGDLVFDVGTNVGNFSEAFVECGARVIAAEPNPACRERLSCLPVTIERVAVADVPGRATLLLAVYRNVIWAKASG